MKIITRDELKIIFKKVKKLRLPSDLEQISFSDLKYYSWEDETDNVIYLVYTFKDDVCGIRCESIRLATNSNLSLCAFCEKPRKTSETSFISTRPRKLPKNINYQTFGQYICNDYRKCNEGLKDTSKIDQYFSNIINN